MSPATLGPCLRLRRSPTRGGAASSPTSQSRASPASGLRWPPWPPSPFTRRAGDATASFATSSTSWSADSGSRPATSISRLASRWWPGSPLPLRNMGAGPARLRLGRECRHRLPDREARGDLAGGPDDARPPRPPARSGAGSSACPCARCRRHNRRRGDLHVPGAAGPSHFLSMNAFEPLLIVALVHVLVRLSRATRASGWPPAGWPGWRC